MTLYRLDLSPTYGKTPETQRPLYKQEDIDDWIFDGVLVPVDIDYKAGLDAQWDHSHGWHSNDDDDLESFTAGVNRALGMDP